MPTLIFKVSLARNLNIPMRDIQIKVLETPENTWFTVYIRKGNRKITEQEVKNIVIRTGYRPDTIDTILGRLECIRVQFTEFMYL